MKSVILFLSILVVVGSLPVKEKTEETKKDSLDEATPEDMELNLEYGRYLQEVIGALESDPEFRKKLETAKTEDIKSGKIAEDLDFVDHNVRTKLDELKRREIERLRQLAKLENERKNGGDISKMKIPLHLDHNNPHQFETEDLRKLIVQLNTDLEAADKQREQQFKQYEMEKNYKYEQELKAMDEEHKKKAQAEHEAQKKKHHEHPKLHHPGSKQQLEEVWEEQDHLNKEDFDSKTFFHLHDLDGNGYWDENEVKALFQKELDKLYDPNAPEDDIRERYEEMERMRQHVFKETDLNRDDLISFDEFMEQTRRSEYERDEGWQGLDEQQVYSEQEYEMFQRERDAEIRRLVESGAMSPPPGFDGLNMPMPAHIQGQQGYDQPMGVHPGNQQIYPPGYQGMPQQPQGYQVPPQGGQHVYQQPQGYQAPPQVGQVYQQPQGYQAPQQGGQQVYQQPNGQQYPQGNYPQQGQPVYQPNGQQAVSLPPGQQGHNPGNQGGLPDASKQLNQPVPQGGQVPVQSGGAPQGNQAINKPNLGAQSNFQPVNPHEKQPSNIKPIESNHIP